ncbi:MAG: lysophospholipid acyltransferase family protein [Deltaproteobacteria bacterium]|nr:lysophospholipid acyltransferase family protein [Deltaproteobacteria bacterium]
MFFPVKLIRLFGIPLACLYQALCIPKIPSLHAALRLAFQDKRTSEEIKKTSKRFLRNHVCRAIDDIILNRLERKDLLENSRIIGLENLQAALSAKKGAMLVDGHCFCSRVAKRFLREIGLPVMSVRNRVPDDPCIGRIGARFLKRRYVDFLKPLIKDEVFIQDKGFNLKIFKRLRENGLVNIHIDTPSFSYKTIEYPFLGRKCRFPAGFLRLAKVAGCPVVPMACIGNSAAFTIIFEEPFSMREMKDEESFLVANLGRLVEILETQILQHPDQWEFWVRL